MYVICRVQVLFKIKSSVLKEVRMTTIVLIRGTHLGRGAKIHLPGFSFWGKLSLLLPEKNNRPLAPEVQGFRDKERNFRVGGFEVICFLFRGEGGQPKCNPPLPPIYVVFTQVINQSS